MVRQRILKRGERIWTHKDFSDLPSSAVAQSLSRLARQGLITRVGRGMYYRPRKTAFGPSLPKATHFAEAVTQHRLAPTGIAAANLLGFTTQNAARPHYVTSASSVPKRFAAAHVTTRRPASRGSLSTQEVALLEFLRNRGADTELTQDQAVHRLVALLVDRESYRRLARVALDEPPRVRAMLGAAGQQAGQAPSTLAPLRASLNPLSRFDFGILRGLRYAKDWQAK